MESSRRLKRYASGNMPTRAMSSSSRAKTSPRMRPPDGCAIGSVRRKGKPSSARAATCPVRFASGETRLAIGTWDAGQADLWRLCGGLFFVFRVGPRIDVLYIDHDAKVRPAALKRRHFLHVNLAVHEAYLFES